MLSIQDLRVSYGDTQVLNGINLHFEMGDSLSLVGESGAGKTTLGLAIMGLSDGEISGRVVFKGEDLLKMAERRWMDLRGSEMAMIFQNVEDTLDPVYKVSDLVAEAISVHQNWDRERVLRKATSLLQAVGLNADKAGSYPHQLSGGERQRAMIAIALANDPEVLMLDEPTASLDSVTKTEIIEMLRSATAGKISLIITHDISTASKLSEKMAVLYAGKIMEMGRTEDLVANPRHPYTRGLMRSYPNMTTTKDLQGIPGHMVFGIKGCPFHERCTQKIEVCSLEEPGLKEAEDGWVVSCHRGGIIPLLQIRGISKSFGSRNVLKDIHLMLYEGETVSLVGESGSGKTTLAKIIMGLHDSDSGEILAEETKVQRRDLDFYRTVQMIFQNPKESLSHRMNVLQLVKEPLDIHKLGRPEDRAARIKVALRLVELPNDEAFLSRYPHQLSGGEAQRVAIARAMVLEPKLLVADEPTSALDASVQAKILRLLLDLQEKRGLSILFITHDIALARKISDRIAVLHKGHLVEEGQASEVISAPQHPYTKTLLQHAADIFRSEEDAGQIIGRKWGLDRPADLISAKEMA